MQYTEGTVTVTDGSTTISGTDTQWTQLSTPLYFRINAWGTPIYEVASITSDTALELTAPYRGTSGSASYVLCDSFSPNFGWPLVYQGEQDMGEWIRRFQVMADSDVAQYARIIQVENGETGDLNYGDMVYLSGVNASGVPIAKKALANASSTMPSVGAVLTMVTSGNITRVVGYGLISPYDTSSFTVGDVLYVSDGTAGGLTATKPTTGYAQAVAVVTEVATTGSIFLCTSLVMV